MVWLTVDMINNLNYFSIDGKKESTRKGTTDT